MNDFSTSLSVTKNISEILPVDIFIVSESGIHSKADITFLKQTGIDAVLVGEFLMAGNTALKISELKKWCAGEN